MGDLWNILNTHLPAALQDIPFGRSNSTHHQEIRNITQSLETEDMIKQIDKAYFE